jgi:hypothetical protein
MNTSKTPEEAAKPFVFSSPEGHALCRRILKEYLPYDPHDVQIEGFCKILDNIDLFAVLATGSGKTSLLSMYILVVLAIKKDPSLCPTANFPDNPCILVEPVQNTYGLEVFVVNPSNQLVDRQIFPFVLGNASPFIVQIRRTRNKTLVFEIGCCYANLHLVLTSNSHISLAYVLLDIVQSNDPPLGRITPVHLCHGCLLFSKLQDFAWSCRLHYKTACCRFGTRTQLVREDIHRG